MGQCDGVSLIKALYLGCGCPLAILAAGKVFICDIYIYILVSEVFT